MTLLPSCSTIEKVPPRRGAVCACSVLVGDLKSQRSITGGSIHAANTTRGSASRSSETLALRSPVGMHRTVDLEATSANQRSRDLRVLWGLEEMDLPSGSIE